MYTYFESLKHIFDVALYYIEWQIADVYNEGLIIGLTAPLVIEAPSISALRTAFSCITGGILGRFVRPPVVLLHRTTRIWCTVYIPKFKLIN